MILEFHAGLSDVVSLILEQGYTKRPLFANIKEQFERIRDSDHFWFKNAKHELVNILIS